MKLSVVIPTWNEAGGIAEAVGCALRFADEVVVADAGSPDGTVALASAAGARVVTSAKGRGTQLAAGADASSGEVLLFLHADARLVGDIRGALGRVLADPAIVGGNFRLRFVPESPSARLFSWANEARRRRLRIYYGDSAVFARRGAYAALGGFAPLPLFEDLDFTRRLERYGCTAHVTCAEVRVSARRFEGRPIRTLGVWAGLSLLHAVGVSPARLAGWYADRR